MMKNIRNLVVALALVVVAGGIGYKIGVNKIETGISSNGQLDLSEMWTVKQKLQEKYLDQSKINNNDLVQGAIQGMVASLGDPYTMYLPPKENKAANEDLQGQFGGVGIELGYDKNGNVAVMAPLPNTPSAKAGVQAGDLIIKITDKVKKIDQDTTGMSLDQAVNLIRGPVGSEVTLKMFRNGQKDSFDVTMKRDNIVVPSSELVMKEQNGKKYAWIRLYKFSDQLYKDWPKMVDQILAEKKNDGDKFGGIVLDLRNNPGGYLNASVMVASDFINDGVIVKQQSAKGIDEVYSVDKTRRNLLNDKLVVLVNGGSASAAEILAGALKDYNRGKLVGEKTFGKGTVQIPEDLPDGAGLHITIARWLLPNGNNIHKIGVNPDVEVKYVAPTVTPAPGQSSNDLPDNQFDKAIDVLNGK